MVDGEYRPPPDPDHGGTLLPPQRLAGYQAGEPTPVAKVWGRLGLQEMPTPASTEHSRASPRGVPSPEAGSNEGDEEPISPLAPRNLFGPGDEDSASEGTSATQDAGVTEDAAPGVEMTIYAEGYADDTYMLIITLLLLLAMLVATSKWLQLTGQEINAKTSLAFSATSSARKKPEALEATLDGVPMPVPQEFWQLGVVVRTVTRRETGPLLQRRIKEGTNGPEENAHDTRRFRSQGHGSSSHDRGSSTAWSRARTYFSVRHQRP